jgi:transcription antitermination factor NusG
VPHRIAVRTPGQREQTIAAPLEKEIGAVVFLPMVRERSRYTGKPIIVPLYKTYLFADIDQGPHWAVIRRHAGVINIVMSGDVPGRCPETEILKLKAAEVCGVVQLAGSPPPPPDQRPAIGAKVKVKFGGLAGHEGRYLAHKGASKARVVVFLLGREVVVEIAAGALAEISA